MKEQTNKNIHSFRLPVINAYEWLEINTMTDLKCADARNRIIFNAYMSQIMSFYCVDVFQDFSILFI